MSVRAFSFFVVSMAAMTGGAQASSFVALGAPSSTPSIIKLGALEPMKAAANTAVGHATTTPSIVALGDPLPDVTYEKVAAIPDRPKTSHGFVPNPMIIRGGIVGGAFDTPAPSPTKATASATAAPAKPAAAAPTTAHAKSDTKTGAPKSPPPPVAAAPQPSTAPNVGKPM